MSSRAPVGVKTSVIPGQSVDVQLVLKLKDNPCMIIASEEYEHQVQVRLADGRTAGIGPGLIRGLFDVTCATSPQDPRENPIAQVIFAFLDESTEAWTSFSYFPIDAFAPRPETICELTDETHPKTHARYVFAYDSRSEWVFRLSDGRVMKTIMKYNDLEIRLTRLETGIGVNLRFLGDHGGQVGDPGEYYRVRYELPMSLFLWRPASIVHDHDNIECEVLDYCDIRHLPGGEPFHRKAGLTPCPIVIA